MKFLLFIFLTLPALGAITPNVVKDRALKFHPSVLAAIENLRAEQETINGSRGAFDAKIVSNYKRQTKHDWNTTVQRTQFEKPLRFAGTKVYAGIEQISNPNGKLAPIYNTGNPGTTGQSGNYKLIGIEFSLWKNLFMDPHRAALANAKYDAQIASSDKKLTELDISKLSQLAYWEWVTAQKVKLAYEDLLKNGETRNDYLIARNKKGDIAKIVVTENEQYVASRKGALQSAQERLLRAEYALSLFYRDDHGEPISLSGNSTYEDYPSNLSSLLDKTDLNSDIEKILENRPEFKKFGLKVEKTNLDLELAKQDLKPQVNVTTEYFQRSERHPDMPTDYLMVMAQVSVPIERNLGNGNIASARARQMVVQKEMNLVRQSYKFEVMSLRQSLQLRLEQVKQSEIEFTKSKELVESETYKFKTGGGNLFLVNLREEAKANAEASFHETRLAFMDTLLNYQALINTAE